MATVNPTLDYKFKAFEKRIKIENVRRGLLAKAKDFSSFALAYFVSDYRGTIIPQISFSPLFWFTAAVYVLIRILIRGDYVQYDQFPKIQFSFLGTAGGFLSFFLAFYANQAYVRFESQYNHSNVVIGKILNVCFLARPLLPAHELWRLVRYLNTAHILGYCGLTGSNYNVEDTFLPINKNERLLTEWEFNRLYDVCMYSFSEKIFKRNLSLKYYNRCVLKEAAYRR